MRMGFWGGGGGGWGDTILHVEWNHRDHGNLHEAQLPARPSRLPRSTLILMCTVFCAYVPMMLGLVHWLSWQLKHPPPPK
jgi:hypothetical protein